MDNSKLTEALVAAQAELKNVVFNRTNPHFKSKYADLSAIREATVPVLTKHGLALSQTTEMQDGVLLLRTRLMHISGETLEGVYPLPMMVDQPQKMGSAFTYAKRYTWAAICGVCADDDDDGNAASGPVKIAQEQADTIRALVDEVGADMPAFLKYLGCAKVDDLPASSYEKAVAALEKKRGA